MAVLILDAEALSSLARPHQHADRHQVVLSTLRSAYRRRQPVRVPAAVLVELYRGQGADAAIDRVLGQGVVRVVTTGLRIARIAGHLLSEAGMGSEGAIDALVVATAIRFGGGLVVTHDPTDLQRLAANHSNVAVAAV